MRNQKKKSNKRKGMNFERKVEKCIASGAFWFDKGDLKTKDYLIECKTTEKKSYRITSKLLQKIWNEALECNKLPMLIMELKDESCRWLIKAVIEKEVK